MFKQGKVKIRDIVFNVMAKMGEVTTHKFPDLLVYALDGYWEYQQDHKRELRTIERVPNSANRIKLPSDFVRFSKIGVKIGDRIEAILNDNQLALVGPNKYEPNESYGAYYDSIPFEGYWTEYGPRDLEAVAWRGYNKQGFFTVDHQCREIILTPEQAGKTVYLEYVSNELKPHSHTYVTQDAYMAISAYIWWQIARFDKKYGDRSSETEMRKKAYLDELRLMKRRQSDITAAGLVFLVRKHTWRGAR